MKNTKLILGALALSAIAAGIFIFPPKENIANKYTVKKLSFVAEDSQSWNLAAQYYNKLRSNVNTGEIEQADYIAASQHMRNMKMNKTTSFSFVDEGPDNVGGRTRAITIDPKNDNIIYAGAVTGGLFKSTNGGNNWSRVQGWDDATEVLSISSTAITNDGTLYVATGGDLFEGGLQGKSSGSQQGDGLWYSTDNGATFTQVNGTNNDDLTKVFADPSKNDVVYISGKSFGAKRMVNKGALEPITGPSLSNSTSTQDIRVSPDGNVLMITSGGTVWSSQDGGNTVIRVTGSSNAGLITGGSSRNESGISYEKNSNGKWNCYVARSQSNGRFGGAWLSQDNGVTWSQIAESFVDGSGGVSWDPTASQGNYNLVIDAVPGFPNQCVLGGINVYKWTKSSSSNITSGTWEALSNWALPKGSQNYVHADVHRFTWNSKDQLFIGSDGGVQVSQDETLTSFYDSNRGYNVTQFYGISYGPDGAVIGGTQDNGTQYNDHKGFYSWLEHAQVLGGDGFESEISYLNEDFFIASLYFSGITRYNGVGNGSSLTTIPTNGSGLGDIDFSGTASGTFYTPLRLFEDDNDINTQDSIMYIPKETKFAGETVNYSSLSFELPLQYTINQDLFVDYDTIFITSDTVTANFDTLSPGDTLLLDGIARDTIMVPDYKQSLFVTHTDLGIYLTRDITRLGIPTEWWRISNLGSQAQTFEFSKDGNCLWIGTSGGALQRVMGLDSAYSFEQADFSYRDSASYKLSIEMVTPGGSGTITDISVDRDNPDKVVVVRGGTGNSHVYYTTNGTSLTPTWTNIDGVGANSLPGIPVYGVEIIANASTNETIIVGTEFGAFVTENINGNGTDWVPINNEIGLVPVFDVRQQWRSRSQGVSNPFAVYLGTHGRGIWRSDDVLSTEEAIIEEEKEDLTNVVVYPNPMDREGKIGFQLNSNSDVTINIYDLQGKLVNRLNRTHLSKGNHVIPFSVHDLPSGTYVVTLETENGSEVTKFIKY